MTDQFSRNPEFIKRLKNILEAQIGNEYFGVRELAKEVGISRSSLHRKVHAFNGNSTSQFIREFRLQKAMELLLKGEETVAEIAYQVGFSSPTYFNTCFKEFYGYPPGEAKLREATAEEQTENTNASNFLTRPKDRINLLKRKLKLTKRWIVFLVILIGLMVGWVASYYMGDKEESQPAQTADFKTEYFIAVLPVKNLSGDPDMDRICYAMTDAIITKFNELESANVIPHNSVLKYQDSDKDAPAIAKELGVDRILLGNYQKYGEQARFTWHLIDGEENIVLFAEWINYDWKLEEMFSIQAAVVEKIATRLRINLDDEIRSDLAEFPTRNREAYDEWLQGAIMASAQTRDSRETAIQHFEKAISLDPAFISPYMNMAYLYFMDGTVFGRITQEEAWYKAKEYLGKAKEIDSTNPYIKKLLLDGLYAYEWDFETMERDYKESSVARAYLIQTGRAEEALDIINDLIARRPNSGFVYANKAEALFHLGRYHEVVEHLERKDSMFITQLPYLREAAKVCFNLQNYERSKWYLDRFMKNFEERPPIIIWLNAVHSSRDGDEEETEMLVMELKKLYQEVNTGSPAWFLALYYCWYGDHETAISWLQKAYERHEIELLWLREEPVLKPLRSDPRYVELYNKVGFPIPPHPN